MFKLREFKNKPSLVRSAIQKNNLQDINCCYTRAGKSYNSEEYERMVYDQIGNYSGEKRSKGMLSAAGGSVVGSHIMHKKDQDMIDEEQKMIEEYYRKYKQSPTKNQRLGVHKRSQVRVGNRGIDEMSSPGSRHSSISPNRHMKRRIEKPKYDDSVQELDEDERMELLAKLEKRKHELLLQIQRLPVCNRSHAVELREKELYRVLDEVSAQALLLSSNKVLIAP